MIRELAKSVASNVLRRFCEAYASTLPTRLITRNDKQPYFYRHYPLGAETEENQEKGIFLHKFVGSDPLNEVHSHPWDWSFAIVLAGSYREIRYKRAGIEKNGDALKILLENRQERTLGPFSINIILHDDLHRVNLQSKDCWTFFVHGPRRSTWGFANEETGAFREIIRRTFHDLPEKNPSHVK